MSKVVKTYVQVLKQEGSGSGPLSFNHDEFDEFIRDLLTIRRDIPKEYRSSVCIAISSYQDNPTEFDIYYYRPETDAERASREAQEQYRSKEATDKRRTEYLKLKAEFEP